MSTIQPFESAEDYYIRTAVTAVALELFPELTDQQAESYGYMAANKVRYGVSYPAELEERLDAIDRHIGATESVEFYESVE